MSKGVQVQPALANSQALPIGRDKHLTPLSHAVEMGRNRVSEAQKGLSYEGQGTYMQKTNMYPTPQGALIVQPAMEHRKQGIQGTVESSLPDLPDVSQPPRPIQHVYNNKSQNLLDEAGNATTTRETEILESIRDITKVMENQIKLSNRNMEEGVIQDIVATVYQVSTRKSTGSSIDGHTNLYRK